MVEIDFELFWTKIESLMIEFDFSTKLGVERRIGAHKSRDRGVKAIKREWNALAQKKHQKDRKRLIWNLTDLALQIASLQYSIGVEHSQWQKWVTIVTIGNMLQKEWDEALLYGAIAGEWALISQFPTPTEPVHSFQTISATILWGILRGCRVHIGANLDEEGQAYAGLLQNIPAKNQKEVALNLATIAKYWILETEGDWKRFYLGSYPAFDSPACAVAAVARYYKFNSLELEADVLDFLEAGLIEVNISDYSINIENNLNQITVKSRRALKHIQANLNDDTVIIDLTSRGDLPWVQLSPFYPHDDVPVPFSPGYTSQTVEGIWQALKVFPNHDVDLTKMSVTNMKGLKRTVRKFGPVVGHRRGVYGSELLSYRDARWQIYLPTYKWMLEHKASHIVAKLRQVAQEKKVILLDYTTNGDVENLTSPLSHAQLVLLYLRDSWPE